jgi:hypothetical protein
MPFPFHLFQRKTSSGLVTETVRKGEIAIKENSKLKTGIKNTIDNVLNFMGLYFWIYGRQKVSNAFVKWVDDFNPDIIYYQPPSYKSIRFVLKLKESVRTPLASHVMDDWFSNCLKGGIFDFYWRKKISENVQSLFDVTTLHLSICDYMSDEYLKRYGHRFYPFHNPVDISFWGKHRRSAFAYSPPFKILYAGRVGYGIEKF